LRGHALSEKLPKIHLFGPSLIHESQLLGSQQHPQIGPLLTSFSTWGTENILAEINMGSKVVIKRCDIFWVNNWLTFAALRAGSSAVIKKKSALKLMDRTL